MGAHFHSLEELVALIQQKHQELINGDLHEGGLNDFISTVQELEERLIIMRFKAYEEAMGQGKKSAVSKQEIAAIDLRNQISLIDAIEEEVQREQEPEEIKEPISLKLKKEAEPVVVAEPIVKKEPVVEEEKPATAPVVEKKESELAETSLNDRLSEQKGKSLNERLQKTPIKDLTKAIGINQKYQFINELFNQNADHFNEVIDELNNCENYKQALSKVRQDLAQNYQWDEEDNNVIAFMDLVERRYLN